MDAEHSTRVTIFTATFRIDGQISLMPGSRLTDFVRSSDAFIAVTDATVRDRAGGKLFESAFLDVGAKFIELILPAELERPSLGPPAA